MNAADQRVFNSEVEPLIDKLRAVCLKHEMPLLLAVSHSATNEGSVEYRYQRLASRNISSTLLLIGKMLESDFEKTSPVSLRRIAQIIVDATTPTTPLKPSINTRPMTESRH